MGMLIIIAILCYLVPAFDCFEILIFRLKVIFSLFPLILSILETTIFVLFYKYEKELITLSEYITYGKHTTLVILSLYFIWVIIPSI